MRLDIYIHDQDQQVAQDAINLLEMVIFFEEYGKLDEGVGDTIKDIKSKTEQMMKKIGLKAGQGKGMIHYLWNTNKNIVKLLYHAGVVATGTSQEKESSRFAIKTIAKSVNKESILDFLYKLDILTLHAVSGPIHIIDAITGWKIGANIQDKIVPAVERAKKALEWLEKTKDTLDSKLKAQVQKYVNALRRVFNLGNFGKITA